MIKQAFSEGGCQIELSTVDTSFNSEIIKLLHDTVNGLMAQLSEKDKQIAALTSIIKNQSGKSKNKRAVFQATSARKSAPIERLINK